MGYFELLTVPNITVDVIVRAQEGRVIALRSLAHPRKVHPRMNGDLEPVVRANTSFSDETIVEDEYDGRYALVPNQKCPTKCWFGFPVPCFEMESKTQLALAHRVDPYQPCPRHEHALLLDGRG